MEQYASLKSAQTNSVIARKLMYWIYLVAEKCRISFSIVRPTENFRIFVYDVVRLRNLKEKSYYIMINHKKTYYHKFSNKQCILQ